MWGILNRPWRPTDVALDNSDVVLLAYITGGKLYRILPVLDRWKPANATAFATTTYSWSGSTAKVPSSRINAPKSGVAPPKCGTRRLMHLLAKAKKHGIVGD